jgi:hypothetical protein
LSEKNVDLRRASNKENSLSSYSALSPGIHDLFGISESQETHLAGVTMTFLWMENGRLRKVNHLFNAHSEQVTNLKLDRLDCEVLFILTRHPP